MSFIIEKENTNERLISVVIPIYKTEKYIANTIASLKHQTFKDFEIVFVDDGSPDESIFIARKEMEQSTIDYTIVRQQNGGQGVARNTGVKNAKGKWIMFLDSDDALQPFALEVYAKALSVTNDVDFLFSDFGYVNEETIFFQQEKDERFEILDRNELLNGFLTRKFSILTPGSLYRKSMLEEQNIWHSAIRWSEDQHFMWQVLDTIQKGTRLFAKTYNYLQRATVGSVMTSTPASKVIEAYQEFVELQKQMKHPQVNDFLLARWVLGNLHVFAKRKNKEEWNLLWDKLEAKKHFKTLGKFPSLKVKVLSIIGRISKGLTYWILTF